MGDLLYVIAVVLVICWAIGLVVFSLGGLIHILLILALLAVLLRIIQGRRG